MTSDRTTPAGVTLNDQGPGDPASALKNPVYDSGTFENLGLG